MTLQFVGNLYSGKDSACAVVTVSVDVGGNLFLQNESTPVAALSDVVVSPRVGNSSRYLNLPDGGRIETRANDDVDALLSHWKSDRSSLAYRLESSRGVVATALCVIVLGLLGFVNWGLPALSGVITDSLPTEFDDQLGGEAFEYIDRLVFEPSQLPAERRDELAALFQSLVPKGEKDYRINFRQSNLIGANALALPDGRVIFTDELVALADNDDMLAAIMLHEIGHVVERHSVQSVVSQAGLSMLLFAITGDVNSSATLIVVMLPDSLLQAQFSRSHETAADTYALEQMRARGIDPNAFADMMERLMVSMGGQASPGSGEEEGGDSNVSQYFSTHPATSSRIERFRQAAKGH